MNNKFSEGQTVIYLSAPAKVTRCWQNGDVWLYDIEIERTLLVFWNVGEANLSLPTDQQLKQSGGAMLPGMEE